MMDAKTWIDVTDTAVKIGMGAFLGGAFAIWRAYVNNRNQAKKSFLDKKREMIERVLKEVDDFYALATVYWANLANAAFKREGGVELTSKEVQDLSELEQQLFVGFKTIGYSSSRLMLIGEKDAEKALQEMRKTIDHFFEIGNIKNSKCTEETLESHKKLIQTARDEFFDTLSIAYRRDE